MPRLVAASQNPENSLNLNDIKEIHQNAIAATKSLGIAKDRWSKAKVMFSANEMLKSFEDKEAECVLRGVKMDEIDDSLALDAWELWCDESIDKLNKVIVN